MQDTCQFLDPSFNTIQMVPLAVWPRYESGCLSRGRATWIALPPQCSDTSLLPWALKATSSYQRISGVFLSQFHEFGVEVFYFKTIHICFYAFQGFIRAFRDNRCFLAFQHCFRFLKNLQPFLELWSLSISTSVWRIPCLWVFQREGTLTSKRANGQREIWGVHALTSFIFRYFDYGDINIIYVKRKV